MEIRRAEARDIPHINRLLEQVLLVHHEGRPDLFRRDSKKYTDAQLLELMQREDRPIFTGWDENGNLLGYAFCELETYEGDNVQMDRKTLYIDDLCVEEQARGNHIGKALYEYVFTYAKTIGCYNVTLNVWCCNPGAMKFYEAIGLTPYKIGMEMLCSPGVPPVAS